jgi:transcriptional regulator with XRE-family HTH domain
MPGRFAGRSICARMARMAIQTRGNWNSKIMAIQCDVEFDFTLLLDGINQVSTEVEDALFAAGCDDATISVRAGRVYLTFSRTAGSLKDAILSAIKSVRASGVRATVLRVDQCTLITQAEIARRIGRTRQLVHQYITGARGPGGFPPPACHITKDAPLWYWCEVAYWLSEHDIIREEDSREAQDLTVINSALELAWQRRMSPEETKAILEELSLCQ